MQDVKSVQIQSKKKLVTITSINYISFPVIFSSNPGFSQFIILICILQIYFYFKKA